MDETYFLYAMFSLNTESDPISSSSHNYTMKIQIQCIGSATLALSAAQLAMCNVNVMYNT